MARRAGREVIDQRRRRTIALVQSLPGAMAEEGRQHLALSVRRKKFAYWLDDHHGDGRVA